MALAGCEGALSTLDPAGPAAREIAGLWWGMLIGSTAIFGLVAGLLVAAFRRGERLPGDDRADGDMTGAEAAGPEAAGPEVAGAEARLEKIWIIRLGLAFPLVTLAALLVWALTVGERLLPRAGPEVVQVHAEAAQWRWRFSYDLPDPPPDGTPDVVPDTMNVLHIPAGRPVDVAITSVDVVHSFWAPRLAGKLDAIPGHVNVLRIEADAPGVYAGRAAEFSGAGYAGHTFEVVAHDAAGWDAFLRGDAE